MIFFRVCRSDAIMMNNDSRVLLDLIKKSGGKGFAVKVGHVTNPQRTRGRLRSYRDKDFDR